MGRTTWYISLAVDYQRGRDYRNHGCVSAHCERTAMTLPEVPKKFLPGRSVFRESFSSSTFFYAKPRMVSYVFCVKHLNSVDSQPSSKAD